MLSTFALVGVLLGAPPGAVIIDVSPADAVVEVDGKPVKTGAVVKVAPGARKVKAQRKGYLSQTKVVTVKQNEKTRVKLKLAKVGGTKVTTITKKKTSPISAGPTTVRKKTVKKTVTPGGTKTVKTTTVRTTRKNPNTITKGPPKRAPVKRRLVSNSKRPATSPTIRQPPKKTVKTVKVVRTAKAPAKKNPKPKVVKVSKTRRSAPAPVADDDGYEEDYGADTSGGHVSGRRGRGSMRPLAGLLILAGGVAVTGGVVVGMSVQEKADEFDESVRRSEKRDLKEEAESRATLANVLYGVGATGLILGGLMWTSEGGAYASVAPLPEGGGYVTVKGSF